MNHLDHEAPLRHLVTILHPGTTLADRVRALRKRRRRRPSAGAVTEESVAIAAELPNAPSVEMPDEEAI